MAELGFEPDSEVIPLTSRLLLKYENRKGDDAIYSIGKIENRVMEMRAVGKKVGWIFLHMLNL